MHRLALVVALAAILAGCPPAPEITTFEDEGEACLVKSDSEPFGDLDEPLTPDDNLEILVFFPIGCLSSSCSDIELAECEASVDGDTITVESDGRVSLDRGGGPCTADCGIMTAECGLPALEEGTYTIVHGANEKTVELPGEPECAGGP